MGFMLAPLLVVAIAGAFASGSGMREQRAAADAASSLSKDDICRLVVLAARKEFVGTPPRHTTLLAQPSTTELAGERGRIWMDVGLTEHGRSRSPLARGETCGDHELVELCDWERLGDRCSRDRKDRERWRVDVMLTVVNATHVDSRATLDKPPRIHRHTAEATVSPVPAFYGHFERGEGGWHEGPDAMAESRRSTHDAKSAEPDAGAH
jgi:hypothetical protein